MKKYVVDIATYSEGCKKPNAFYTCNINAESVEDAEEKVRHMFPDAYCKKINVLCEDKDFLKAAMREYELFVKPHLSSKNA